jgi:hypothetical protein
MKIVSGMSIREKGVQTYSLIIENKQEVIESMKLSQGVVLSTVEVFVWVYDGNRYVLQTFSNRQQSFFIENRRLYVKLPAGSLRVKIRMKTAGAPAIVRTRKPVDINRIRLRSAANQHRYHAA